MLFLTKIKDYFIGAIAEMKKVVWPDKKQIKLYTALVLSMSVGMAAFFGVLDYVLSLGLEQVIK